MENVGSASDVLELRMKQKSGRVTAWGELISISLHSRLTGKETEPISLVNLAGWI